ncbi:fructokinase [Pelomonas sp. V22]|uniref:PfkB family carbohydrate kinase n=1 Tax=Pelomonas sp. V22 TaxID=2822139 RepID=UPI0024A82FE7|nr:PfkB family carbohydrate kinase [Pelomonas sp. V22]MDI4632891.1 fructokinase [Pelomonas sp. V22]
MAELLPLGPVLLIGEALVDEFADGPVAGGAPLNVARSLASLGQAVQLASRVGQDYAGALRIRQAMRRSGLSERGLQVDARHPTGRVHIVESPQGHRFEIARVAAWDHLDPHPVLALAEEEQPGVVYFGSLQLRRVATRMRVGHLLQALDQGGRLFFLDLNLRDDSRNPEIAEACLHQADWLKVNDEELAQLMQWFLPDADPTVTEPLALQDVVGRLMQRFDLRLLVLTRGPLGHAAFAADGRLLAEGPASPVAHLVDTVGAGDAFSAMLLAATLAGRAPPEALRLASGFAAAMCGERGPAPADPAFFHPWREALGLAPLQPSLAEIR